MDTHGILGLLEDHVDIIVGLPEPGNALVVVAESTLEDQLELDEHDGLGRLLVDLSSQCQPCALAEEGEGVRVLVVGAVEACRKLAPSVSGTQRGTGDSLVALRI
jgi:hypothetical protein